jgi:hypothetical protein
MRWPGKRRGIVATYVIFHEVDDVEHWLRSPKRREVFAEPAGLTFRVFTDPAKTNRVALVVDIPDFEAFQQPSRRSRLMARLRSDAITRAAFPVLTSDLPF